MTIETDAARPTQAARAMDPCSRQLMTKRQLTTPPGDHPSMRTDQVCNYTLPSCLPALGSTSIPSVNLGPVSWLRASAAHTTDVCTEIRSSFHCGAQWGAVDRDRGDRGLGGPAWASKSVLHLICARTEYYVHLAVAKPVIFWAEPTNRALCSARPALNTTDTQGTGEGLPPPVPRITSPSHPALLPNTCTCPSILVQTAISGQHRPGRLDAAPTGRLSAATCRQQAGPV